MGTIEVHIGTVEIRAVAPSVPVNGRPSSGFGDYRSMRGYVSWGLDGDPHA
jgi:hypothetical protein